jgi:hypothetical protein
MALSVVLSAASLIICGFSFIYFQGYLRRRTGAERLLADFEEEVNKIIAGIDAATDRDITLLEDKAKSIKALLETLDKRLAVYAREVDRHSAQDAALTALGGAEPSIAGKPAPRGVRTEEAYTALGRGLKSLRVYPAAPPVPPGPALGTPFAAEEEPPPVTPADSPDPPSGESAEINPAEGAFPQPRFVRSANPVKSRTPLTERALELSRNGFSPDTIAARLGVTIAEVDLALAISERKKTRDR